MAVVARRDGLVPHAGVHAGGRRWLAAAAFAEYRAARRAPRRGSGTCWSTLSAMLVACGWWPPCRRSDRCCRWPRCSWRAAIVLAPDRSGRPLRRPGAAVRRRSTSGVPLGAAARAITTGWPDASGAAADGHRDRERHGAVLRRPLFGRTAAGAARQPEEDASRARSAASWPRRCSWWQRAHCWLPAVPAAWLAGIGSGSSWPGIIGDLFESMLEARRRHEGQRHLIPGHGGVLDRVDALLFAAPMFYFFLAFRPRCRDAASRTCERALAILGVHRIRSGTKRAVA